MGLVRLLVRLAVVAGAAVLAVALMAVALVTLTGVLVWGWLRRRGPAARPAGVGRGRPPGRGGEVVDVEVREVQERQPGEADAKPVRQLAAPRNE